MVEKNKLNLKFSAPFTNTVLSCTSILLLYLSAGRGMHSYTMIFMIFFFLAFKQVYLTLPGFDRQLGSNFLFKLISFLIILSVTTLYKYSSHEIH